jgi:hypothetical protein
MEKRGEQAMDGYAEIAHNMETAWDIMMCESGCEKEKNSHARVAQLFITPGQGKPAVAYGCVFHKIWVGTLQHLPVHK